jgi:hypothetical protein
MLMLEHKQVPYRRVDIVTLLHPLVVRLHGFDAGGQTRNAGGRRTFGLRLGDRFFQLERLLVFSRKFAPEWRPRYLCVEKLTDLPLVGLAYLHVEQLLVAPGRWTRRERVSH